MVSFSHQGKSCPLTDWLVMVNYLAPKSTLAECVAHYADLAGDDFMWEGVSGGSKQSSKFKRLQVQDMLERQGGICPKCGTGDDDMRGPFEYNHIVASGPLTLGYNFVGNAYAGHKGCNASTAPRYADGKVVAGKAILTEDDLVRPDLVPMEWTPLPALKRAAGLLK